MIRVYFQVPTGQMVDTLVYAVPHKGEYVNVGGTMYEVKLVTHTLADGAQDYSIRVELQPMSGLSGKF